MPLDAHPLTIDTIVPHRSASGKPAVTAHIVDTVTGERRPITLQLDGRDVARFVHVFAKMLAEDLSK